MSVPGVPDGVAAPLAGRPVSRRAVATSILRALLTTTALVLLYFVVPTNGSPSVSAGALMGVGLLAFTVLLSWQIRSITRSPSPRLRALEVVVTTIPLLMLAFAASYYLMARSDAAAFSSQSLTRLDALYFTVTTFATVGFGDIVARSEAARAAVTVQMSADLVVIGVVAKLLVGAVRVGLSRRDVEPSAEASSHDDDPGDGSLHVAPPRPTHDLTR